MPRHCHALIAVDLQCGATRVLQTLIPRQARGDITWPSFTYACCSLPLKRNALEVLLLSRGALLGARALLRVPHEVLLKLQVPHAPRVLLVGHISPGVGGD